MTAGPQIFVGKTSIAAVSWHLLADAPPELLHFRFDQFIILGSRSCGMAHRFGWNTPRVGSLNPFDDCHRRPLAKYGGAERRVGFSNRCVAAYSNITEERLRLPFLLTLVPYPDPEGDATPATLTRRGMQPLPP